MSKTDELISKLEEYLKYILKYACVTDSDKSIRMTNFESEISELKEQIKKEQIIKDLSGEKIEDVKTITSTENPENNHPSKEWHDIIVKLCDDLRTENIELKKQLSKIVTDKP